MKLNVVTVEAGMTRIELIGKLDVAGEAEIGDQLRSLVEVNKTDFLVDMSQVTYLASLGIRLLFAAAKKLSGEGKKLVVLKPQPMVEETLETSGTVKFIPIAPDEEAALEIITGA